MAAPERVDAVAWALLTLHAYIDMHVKRFKVSLLHVKPLCCSKRDILANIVLIFYV